MPWGIHRGGTLPGQDRGYPRGYPGRVPTWARMGGTQVGSPSWQGTPPGQDGGYPFGYSPAGYPPGQGTHLAGYPPGQGTPPQPGQDGGGTQLGQQKEYSLHGGQYASCVHAGGLSCFHWFQWELCCKCHRSVNSVEVDVWRKRALIRKINW